MSTDRKIQERQIEPKGRLKGALSRLRPGGATANPALEALLKAARTTRPKDDFRLVTRAFEVSSVVHEGQMRLSGEPFISHPLGVAHILADLGMDPTTIAVALLHDTVEDTSLELGDLKDEFGEEIAMLIDGLTKIERIDLSATRPNQAANLRKMIVAMARDPRVLIVKVADRLHNLETVDVLPPAKRERMATETLEIFAPLAHRLGMQELKSKLEDAAFRTLSPMVYDEIRDMVSKREPASDQFMVRALKLIEDRLKEARVRAQVTGRSKNLYSINQKMLSGNLTFDEIYDLAGVRIIVSGLRECYAALGVIHASFRPVPGRFKDYIAVPKFNLYQSLHTTVAGVEGRTVEVQIRTAEMHQVAEKGLAAHWQYKQDPRVRNPETQAAWMNRMLEMEQDEDDSEFLRRLRVELVAGEVFVFTPKGDVVELPRGATPLDLAYHVHTQVGQTCVGAKVNGRIVPLSYQLASGDVVEVMTSKRGSPSRDWLDMVITPRARTKIRQWFTKEQREEAIAEGQQSLQKALRRAGLPVNQSLREGEFRGVLDSLKYDDLEALYVAIGEGRVSASTVVTRYVRTLQPAEEETPLEPKPARIKQPPMEGVLVEGTSADILLRLARCCMPVPPDDIVGFVTRGRGLRVHRDDCPNVVSLRKEGERMVPVSWSDQTSGLFPVTIKVTAIDRPKLLRDVTTAISDLGLSITQATAGATGGTVNLRFTVEVTHPSQLQMVLGVVRKVEGVYDAFRLTPGAR